MKNKFIGISDSSFLDIYSIIHLVFGLIIGIILFLIPLESNWLTKKENYFIIGFIVLILWEIFECLLRWIKKYYPDLTEKLMSFLPDCWFAKENLLNSFGDLIVGLVGLILVFFIAKHIL